MVQKNNQLEQMSIKSINAGTISLIQDFKESRNSLCFDLRIIQSKQKTQNIFFHMIDGWDFFDQPIRNGTRIHYNIQKIDTGQGDDYAIGCLLDYSYLKKILV